MKFDKNGSRTSEINLKRIEKIHLKYEVCRKIYKELGIIKNQTNSAIKTENLYHKIVTSFIFGQIIAQPMIELLRKLNGS